jgi:hypothetical protein
VQESFAKVSTAIAEKYGAAFKNPGPKTHGFNKQTGKLEFRQSGVDRMKEKIATKGYKTAARVTDAVRGAFEVKHPDDVKKIVNELAKTYELTVEQWRTDQLAGYTDRAAIFRDPRTGMLGEIQFIEPRMSKAKADAAKGGGGGHETYKQVEELARKDKNDPQIAVLNAKMRNDIYGPVLEAYRREGSAWTNTIRLKKR